MTSVVPTVAYDWLVYLGWPSQRSQKSMIFHRPPQNGIASYIYVFCSPLNKGQFHSPILGARCWCNLSMNDKCPTLSISRGHEFLPTLFPSSPQEVAWGISLIGALFPGETINHACDILLQHECLVPTPLSEGGEQICNTHWCTSLLICHVSKGYYITCSLRIQ